MWKQEMLEQLNKSCEKKYQQEGLSPLTEALELMSAPNKTELKKQLEENKKNIDQQLDKFINTAFKNFGNQTGRYTQIFDRVFIASNKFKLLEKKLRHARRAFQQNNAASAGGNYEEMSQDYSRYTLIETHLVEMIVLIKTKEIIEAMISRGMYLSAARMLTTAVVQVKNQAAVLNANTLPDLFRAMTPMRDFLIKEPSILRGKVMEKVLCYVFRRASFGLVDYIATDKRRKMRQRVLRRARLESETGRQDIRNVNVEKSDNNSIEHDDDTMRLFVWFISLTPIGRRIGLPSPLEYNLSISDLMMASGKTNKQNQQQQQSTKKGSNDKSLNNSDQINQQNNIPQLKVVSNIASLVKNAAAASIIDANAQLPPLTECVAFFSRETQYGLASSQQNTSISTDQNKQSSQINNSNFLSNQLQYDSSLAMNQSRVGNSLSSSPSSSYSVATSTLNFVSSTSINVLKDLMEDGVRLAQGRTGQQQQLQQQQQIQQMKQNESILAQSSYQSSNQQPLSVLFDRFNSNIESRRGINSNSSNSDTFESSQFLMMLRTLVHLKLPLEKLTSTLPIAAHIYRLTAECIVMYSSLLAVHGPGSSVNEDEYLIWGSNHSNLNQGSINNSQLSDNQQKRLRIKSAFLGNIATKEELTSFMKGNTNKSNSQYNSPQSQYSQISQLHTFQQQNKRSASTSARIVNRGPVQQQNNNEAKKLIRSISVDRITTTKFMRKINESQKIKRNETMQKRIMHEKIMRSICSGGKSGLDRSTILISLLLAHFSHALNMLNTTIAAFERIEASSQIKLQQEQPIQHLITSSPSIISNSLSDLDDKSFVHDMNLRTTVLSYAVTTMCHCIKLVCEQAFGNNLKIQLPNIIITDTNIASKAILPAAINFKDNSNQKPYGLSRNSSQAMFDLTYRSSSQIQQQHSFPSNLSNSYYNPKNYQNNFSFIQIKIQHPQQQQSSSLSDLMNQQQQSQSINRSLAQNLKTVKKDYDIVTEEDDDDEIRFKGFLQTWKKNKKKQKFYESKSKLNIMRNSNDSDYSDNDEEDDELNDKDFEDLFDKNKNNLRNSSKLSSYSKQQSKFNYNSIQNVDDDDDNMDDSLDDDPIYVKNGKSSFLSDNKVIITQQYDQQKRKQNDSIFTTVFSSPYQQLDLHSESNLTPKYKPPVPPIQKNFNTNLSQQLNQQQQIPSSSQSYNNLAQKPSNTQSNTKQQQQQQLQQYQQFSKPQQVGLAPIQPNIKISEYQQYSNQQQPLTPRSPRSSIAIPSPFSQQSSQVSLQSSSQQQISIQQLNQRQSSSSSSSADYSIKASLAIWLRRISTSNSPFSNDKKQIKLKEKAILQVLSKIIFIGPDPYDAMLTNLNSSGNLNLNVNINVNLNRSKQQDETGGNFGFSLRPHRQRQNYSPNTANDSSSSTSIQKGSLDNFLSPNLQQNQQQTLSSIPNQKPPSIPQVNANLNQFNANKSQNQSNSINPSSIMRKLKSNNSLLNQQQSQQLQQQLQQQSPQQSQQYQKPSIKFYLQERYGTTTESVTQSFGVSSHKLFTFHNSEQQAPEILRKNKQLISLVQQNEIQQQQSQITQSMSNPQFHSIQQQQQQHSQQPKSPRGSASYQTSNVSQSSSSSAPINQTNQQSTKQSTLGPIPSPTNLNTQQKQFDSKTLKLNLNQLKQTKSPQISSQVTQFPTSGQIPTKIRSDNLAEDQDNDDDSSQDSNFIDDFMFKGDLDFDIDFNYNFNSSSSYDSNQADKNQKNKVNDEYNETNDQFYTIKKDKDEIVSDDDEPDDLDNENEESQKADIKSIISEHKSSVNINLHPTIAYKENKIWHNPLERAKLLQLRAALGDVDAGEVIRSSAEKMVAYDKLLIQEQYMQEKIQNRIIGGGDLNRNIGQNQNYQYGQGNLGQNQRGFYSSAVPNSLQQMPQQNNKNSFNVSKYQQQQQFQAKSGQNPETSSMISSISQKWQIESQISSHLIQDDTNLLKDALKLNMQSSSSSSSAQNIFGGQSRIPTPHEKVMSELTRAIFNKRSPFASQSSQRITDKQQQTSSSQQQSQSSTQLSFTNSSVSASNAIAAFLPTANTLLPIIVSSSQPSNTGIQQTETKYLPPNDAAFRFIFAASSLHALQISSLLSGFAMMTTQLIKPVLTKLQKQFGSGTEFDQIEMDSEIDLQPFYQSISKLTGISANQLHTADILLSEIDNQIKIWCAHYLNNKINYMNNLVLYTPSSFAPREKRDASAGALDNDDSNFQLFDDGQNAGTSTQSDMNAASSSLSVVKEENAVPEEKLVLRASLGTCSIIWALGSYAAALPTHYDSNQIQHIINNPNLNFLFQTGQESKSINEEKGRNDKGSDNLTNILKPGTTLNQIQQQSQQLQQQQQTLNQPKPTYQVAVHKPLYSMNPSPRQLFSEDVVRIMQSVLKKFNERIQYMLDTMMTIQYSIWLENSNQATDEKKFDQKGKFGKSIKKILKMPIHEAIRYRDEETEEQIEITFFKQTGVRRTVFCKQTTLSKLALLVRSCSWLARRILILPGVPQKTLRNLNYISPSRLSEPGLWEEVERDIINFSRIGTYQSNMSKNDISSWNQIQNLSRIGPSSSSIQSASVFSHPSSVKTGSEAARSLYQFSSPGINQLADNTQSQSKTSQEQIFMSSAQRSMTKYLISNPLPTFVQEELLKQTEPELFRYCEQREKEIKTRQIIIQIQKQQQQESSDTGDSGEQSSDDKQNSSHNINSPNIGITGHVQALPQIQDFMSKHIMEQKLRSNQYDQSPPKSDQNKQNSQQSIKSQSGQNEINFSSIKTQNFAQLSAFIQQRQDHISYNESDGQNNEMIIQQNMQNMQQKNRLMADIQNSANKFGRGQINEYQSPQKQQVDNFIQQQPQQLIPRNNASNIYSSPNAQMESGALASFTSRNSAQLGSFQNQQLQSSQQSSSSFNSNSDFSQGRLNSFSSPAINENDQNKGSFVINQLSSIKSADDRRQTVSIQLDQQQDSENALSTPQQDNSRPIKPDNQILPLIESNSRALLLWAIARPLHDEIENLLVLQRRMLDLIRIEDQQGPENDLKSVEGVILEPDRQVVNLSKKLLTFSEETLTALLPFYNDDIFGGLDDLITTICTKELSQMKDITKKKLIKMQSNIFTLQQTLCMISPQTSHSFEVLRHRYDLVALEINT